MRRSEHSIKLTDSNRAYLVTEKRCVHAPVEYRVFRLLFPSARIYRDMGVKDGDEAHWDREIGMFVVTKVDANGSISRVGLTIAKHFFPASDRLIVEAFDIPCPVVHNANEVRYRYARWEKKTKKGWVPIG